MEAQERTRLIQRYGEGPEALLAAWNACPPEVRGWKPAATEWSALEIVQHCQDSETFAATRIRLLLAEPDPVIVGYDQDAWVRTFACDTLAAEDAFSVIAAVRKSTHRLIEQLHDWQWEASGRHTESGPYTAHDWLAIYGVHLHDHANQIRSNVEAWAGRPHGPQR